jgi:hypothetical protein
MKPGHFLILRSVSANTPEGVSTPMPAESPFVRQRILLRALCARYRGATVKDLAAEMSVSSKTICRDRETFQRAGFRRDQRQL